MAGGVPQLRATGSQENIRDAAHLDFRRRGVTRGRCGPDPALCPRPSPQSAGSGVTGGAVRCQSLRLRAGAVAGLHPDSTGGSGPLGLRGPEDTMDDRGKSGRNGPAGSQAEPRRGPSTLHAQPGLRERSLSKLSCSAGCGSSNTSHGPLSRGWTLSGSADTFSPHASFQCSRPK